MFITKELLELNGACSEHVAIFARQWPKGVEVTLESLNEAHAIGLDIFWLESLIPADKQAEYEAKWGPLLDEYKAKQKSLWDEYKAKQKPLWDEYEAKLIKVLTIALSE